MLYLVEDVVNLDQRNINLIVKYKKYIFLMLKFL